MCRPPADMWNKRAHIVVAQQHADPSRHGSCASPWAAQQTQGLARKRPRASASDRALSSWRLAGSRGRQPRPSITQFNGARFLMATQASGTASPALRLSTAGANRQPAPNPKAGAGSRLAVLALILMSLIWGYNWVVMKQVIQYVDPFDFSDRKS